MKRTHSICLLVAMNLAGLGILGGAPLASVGDSAWIGPSDNTFACDLYDRLSTAQPGNLFFSPISIEAALTMIEAGARGQTAAQMSQVLHLPGSGPIHQELGVFLGELTGSQAAAESARHYQLSLANGLWVQKNYEIQPDFLDLLKTDYGAPPHEVDYVNRHEAVRQAINTWVEKETHDKIRDLIAPDALSAATRLVLCNAIYFKGHWAVQFDHHFTRNSPFQVTPDHPVTVPMMEQTGEYGYLEDDGLQALKLPYVGDELSMVILLPRKIDGLAKIEKSLTAERLSHWLTALRSRKVAVFLPHFKLETGFELSQTLQTMGMTDAFTSVADFSGLTPRRGLFISQVIHKAFVEVTEEGTEAAAATAVGMTAEVVRMDQPPVFRADHPFLFLIRHEKSGAILFLGRLSEPQPN